jgi:putative membrane protein
MLPVSFLRSWSLPPFATFALVLSAIFYLRGWCIVRGADQSLLPSWRAGAFLSGLGFVWIALASPLDALNELLLTAHMLQHMLLMMVAPPLILLGAPLIPMVRGLPGVVVRRSIGSFLNWPAAERIGRALANPIAGALAMGLAMFAWHTPSLYELALRSESWHEVEHATFFLASLIFWWPVVLPWPSRGQWPRWAMVPYLLVADLQNTALSAILAFSDRVLYRSYSEAPRLSGLSALEDQVAAGAFMWLAGSMAFIVPAIGVAVQCLSMRSARDPMSTITGAESTIRS